jgi:hypothetical protein
MSDHSRIMRLNGLTPDICHLISGICHLMTEQPGQLMQLRLPIAKLLQGGDGRDDIVAIRARDPVTLPHMVQLLVEREPSRILRVAAIDQVAQRRHSLPGLPAQPDRADRLAVNRRNLLALAQIRDGLRTLGGAYPIGNSAAGSSPVEPQDKARPFSRSAMDKGVDAERAVGSHKAGLQPLDKRKVRPPHQRAVGEHPQIFPGVHRIGVHEAV